METRWTFSGGADDGGRNDGSDAEDRIAESWHLQDYYSLMAQMGAIDNVMRAEVDPYPAWS